jgi:hypothetical protein
MVFIMIILETDAFWLVIGAYHSTKTHVYLHVAQYWTSTSFLLEAIYHLPFIIFQFNDKCEM